MNKTQFSLAPNTYLGASALTPSDRPHPDVVVLGLPFDLATTGRAGARYGPSAIRAASIDYAGRVWPWNFDPLKALIVRDAGDCQISPGPVEDIVRAIETAAGGILALNTSLLVLGGDHFITYPILRAYCRTRHQISLLHFDAHADTYHTDAVTLNHGAPFYYALKEDLIDASSSVQVGIRTHYRDLGFHVLDMQWIADNGAENTCVEIRKILGTRDTYLSFDVDFLDPAFAPGTGTPVPGGGSTQIAAAIIRGLAGVNLIGMDIVEVCPPYDLNDNTARAAAYLGAEYLCRLSANREAPR